MGQEEGGGRVVGTRVGREWGDGWGGNGRDCGRGV